LTPGQLRQFDELKAVYDIFCGAHKNEEDTEKEDMDDLEKELEEFFDNMYVPKNKEDMEEKEMRTPNDDDFDMDDLITGDGTSKYVVDLKDVLDFYDFRKSKGSNVTSRDCLKISNQELVQSFVKLTRRMSQEYGNDKEGFLNDIKRVIEMEG
jgi:hypothetical protein